MVAENTKQVDFDRLENIIRRFMWVSDITLGSARDHFLVRYRGRLFSEDTEAAYDQVAEAFQPYGVVPLFRPDGDRHAVLLEAAPAVPVKVGKPGLNLILFLLTVISVFFAGGTYGLEALPADPFQVVITIITRGWPFAASLLGILVAHEFGHYLVGRWHGVNVSLPYFIPLPFGGFGTMGAFISMKSRPKNKRHLLDIGIAGPLAGLVIAIPVLYLGLKLSQVEPFTSPPPGFAATLEGNSILYLAMKYLAFGKLLPAPASYGDLSPVLYWIRYFFTSRPLPMGGEDVMLNSVAWAGWGGLLVTALNLIPAGTLDGGHVFNVLFNRKTARTAWFIILLVLGVLGIFWMGWWIWAFLIFFLGRVYGEPLDSITPLDNKRKALAVLALVVFALTFTPVPLVTIM